MRRVNPTGSVARIGLTATDHDTDIQVDLSMDRFAELESETRRQRLRATQTSACVCAGVCDLRNKSWQKQETTRSMALITATSPDRLPEPASLEQIREALRGLKYGIVSIIVQDGVVVQIERTEKRRLR